MQVPLVGTFFSCCFFVQLLAFNLDVENPLVLRSDQEGDGFGYSVALAETKPKDPKWLLVGAPNHMTISLKKGAGQICSINGSCSISQISFDYSPYNSWHGSALDVKENGMLLGNAVAIGHDKILICGPKLFAKSYHHQSGQYLMHGICAWRTTESTSYKTLNPLSDTKRKLKYWAQSTSKNFLQGESGFSVDILKTAQEEVQFLIGAPNILEGRGSVVRYSVYKNGTVGNLIVPDTFDAFKVHPFVNIGYTVTAGKYFSKNKTLYASGAPNFMAQGTVLVFDFPQNYDGPLQMKVMLNSSETGDKFGAALASGDLNRDGLDELIVGAPLFSVEGGRDEGRVVIFSGNTTNAMINKKPIVLKGTVEGGRFGMAVAYLGDLDQNKYGDIAIAAPYEGNGVVYIFYGGPNGFSFNIKLIGSNFVPSISTFGFSISKGADFDSNGYNDFAIGAYKSGHVVVFRSKPVITLVQTLTPLDKTLTMDNKNFTVRDCVKFKGHKGPVKLTVVRALDLGMSAKRIFYKESEYVNASLLSEKNKIFCTDLIFYLKENVTDFVTPLKMTVSYKLENKTAPPKKRKLDAKLAPILLKNYSMETEINFARLCGENQECVADLQLDIRFINAKTDKEINQYIIGDDSNVKFRVFLRNTEMAAYGSKLSIRIPAHFHPRLTGRCQEAEFDEEEDSEKEIKCTIINPLLQGRNQTFLIELESSEVALGKEAPTFSAQVTTNSLLTNSSVTTQTAVLKLVVQAGATISGKHVDEIIQFNVKNKAVPFELRFHVEKYGISPFQNAEVIINIPYAITRGKEFLKIIDLQTTLGSCKLEKDVMEEFTQEGSAAANEAIDQVAEEVDDYESLESNENTTDHSRKKRELTQNLIKYPANRTLLLNCTSRVWSCKSLRCNTGPIFEENELALITLNAEVDFSVLKKRLGIKDIAQIMSDATVRITKPENVQTPEIKKKNLVIVAASFKRVVQKWDLLDPLVITLSIICSLLLLLLITSGLVKAGFFHRESKEEMQIRMRIRPPIVSLKDLQIMHQFEEQQEAFC